MKQSGMIVCWLMLVANPATAQEPTYRYSNAIEFPPIAQPELIAVPLGAEQYAATRRGLEDIRVHNGSGKTVSFLWQRATETKTESRRHYWPGTDPQLRLLDGNGLELTLELKKEAPQPEGLCIITPLKNFENRVRISTSEDGEEWEQVGEETLIFDYSKYMDVNHNCIPFPATGRRHFQIVIEDITAEQESTLLELTRSLRQNEETGKQERLTIERRPFRIDRIDFWRETSVQKSKNDLTVPYPVKNMTSSTDEEKQETLLLFDVDNVPLTSLTFEIGDRIFSRQIQLQIEQSVRGTDSWNTIATQTISRIDFQNIQREQLEITFPESRNAKYRIVINNRDSAPLDVKQITARGNVYQAIFAAEPETEYKLSYGFERAMAPKYDTAAISQLLDEGIEPVAAKLGEQVEVSEEAAPTPFAWSQLFNNGPVMIGLIILLVVILAAGLYSAGKRLNEVDNP